jgi:hypothetical protein
MTETTFSVYDNTTNEKILAFATWEEVEDYVECNEKYTVVCNLNGWIM